MEVQRRPIASLVPDPANARKHSAKNLDAIKGSLAKFGQVEPLVVQKSTGIVIGGNGRLAVMREIGMKEVDVVEVDLNPTQATALAIALNRTAELAEWDDAALEAQLKALQLDDFPIAEIGFDPVDLGNGTEGKTDPDAVPENVETRCKPGDLWKLGNHRLLCGDSTNVQHVERLMGGEKADLLYTDPPYGVEYDESWREASSGHFGGSTKGMLQNDDRVDWGAAFSILQAPVAYVWHASRKAHIVRRSLEDAGYDVRQEIIWRKPFGVLSPQAYNWEHEPCWYAVRKGATANWIGDHKQTTVWDAENPNHCMSKKGDGDVKTGHPTMKPVKLGLIAIQNHKAPIVADLFLGSGSTLIACEKTGRRCFGMEIDPHYCSVILDRWEQFTGRKAELLGNG